MVAGTGDGDDPRPDVSCDLHRSGADATRRGGHEHGFTSLQLGAVDEPFIRSAGRDHKPGGLGKVDAVGDCGGSVNQRGGELGKAATP